MRFFFICIFLLSCNNSSVHSDYYKNLNVVKSVVSSINIYYNSDKPLDISQYYTDDFIFHSYAAGNSKGQETLKMDYISGLENMREIGVSLHIGHSIYLPGIDEHTFNLDGSVRVYYGANLSNTKSSVDFSGYQTINFKNGKIEEIWEWADYGGVQKSLEIIE